MLPFHKLNNLYTPCSTLYYCYFRLIPPVIHYNLPSLLSRCHSILRSPDTLFPESVTIHLRTYVSIAILLYEPHHFFNNLISTIVFWDLPYLQVVRKLQYLELQLLLSSHPLYLHSQGIYPTTFETPTNSRTPTSWNPPQV